MKLERFKAALFDLDGVVLDTERQYSEFWNAVMQRYFPDRPGLGDELKGTTLTDLFDLYFNNRPEEQHEILSQLNDFERVMDYNYIPGVEAFVSRLRVKGIKTAVVTSSAPIKMCAVYNKLPMFPTMFDKIFTSEDVKVGKPAPDCYLSAAARFAVRPSDCIVFEDSFNGLRSARAAGMYVVGLATTNSVDAVRPFCDEVIHDFVEV